MADRISRADVDRLAQTVSDTLRDGLHVTVQSRNGYFGLDLYDPHGMVDVLTVGTKREVYTYLQGMRRYSLIIGRS